MLRPFKKYPPRPHSLRGRRLGFSGDAGEGFKMLIKKSMRNHNFRPIFDNFNESFAIFTKSLEFFREKI